jgi:hypothetical protein
MENLIRKIRTGNDVAGGALRERTPGKRHRVDPEGNTGIKDPGARQQLRLRNEKTAGRISWKTHEKMFGLETVKRTAGSPVPLQKSKVWTLWRGRPPPKHKMGVTHGVRAGNVGAPATRILSPHNWNMIDHLDVLLLYQSAAWDERTEGGSGSSGDERSHRKKKKVGHRNDGKPLKR